LGDEHSTGSFPARSFPNCVWERTSRNSVSSPGPDAKQSFADRRSQTEFGNERNERERIWDYLPATFYFSGTTRAIALIRSGRLQYGQRRGCSGEASGS